VTTVEERDILEFTDVTFRGVTVGGGSLVLLFAGNISISIQCPFACREQNSIRLGHGEKMMSSPILLGYLNHVVTCAAFDDRQRLTLLFSEGRHIRLLPRHGGFESYALNTQLELAALARMLGSLGRNCAARIAARLKARGAPT
jgi:hypothetical protein